MPADLHLGVVGEIIKEPREASMEFLPTLCVTTITPHPSEGYEDATLF